MGRLETARDNHITRWVLPTASRLLIEAACKDAPVRPLDEVAHIEMGQSPSGESCNQDGDGVLLIGGPADLGLKYPDATRWTNQPTKLCRQGDIIVCVRATIGEPRWSDGVYCLGRGVAGIRPLSSDIDSRFLFRIIEGNEDWLRSQGTGTTFKTISKVHLARIKVPIIPKDEQQQISSFLQWIEDNSGNHPDFSAAPPLPLRVSEQQRIVAKIEALAAKIREAENLRQLVKWEQGRLFGSLIEQIVINELVGTPKKKLIELVEKDRGISYGVVLTGSPHSEGIPTLRAGDLRMFHVRLDNVKLIDPEIEIKYKRTRLLGNEVLLRIRGGIGEVALCPNEIIGGNVSREIAVIPVIDSIIPRFIMYLISSPSIQQMMIAKLRGTSYIGINLKDVRNLPIPVVSLDTQKAIIDRLDAMRSQLNMLSHLQAQTAAELDALLPAILDRAFKGEL
jgi:type I restriction enzyme, S subunit